MGRIDDTIRRARRSSFAYVGSVCFLTVSFAVWLLPDAAMNAQGPGAPAVGYTSCAGSECHTRSGEIGWLTDQDGGKQHRNSLNKLRKSPDDSEKYAKAVGLANFEDPNGMCVKCHAVKAKTLEGVGCEACHGGGTGYREYHSQMPKDYQGSLQRGMRDLDQKPANWIKVCRDCHVLVGRPEYAKLISDDVGHKDGAKWNVAKKYSTIQTHWKKSTGAVMYTEAQIASAAEGKVVDIAAGSKETPTPSVAKPDNPVTSPSSPPGATPARVIPSGVPPAAGPTTAPANPTTISKAPAPKESPTPAPMVRSGTPTANVPATPAMTPPTTAATSPSATPVMPMVSVVSPLSIAPPPPVSAQGLLAAFQDRVEALLTSLLQRNSAPPAPLTPPAPAAVSGPDAELLRLQYEAIRLAVEALNLKPRPGGGPPK